MDDGTVVCEPMVASWWDRLRRGRAGAALPFVAAAYILAAVVAALLDRYAVAAALVAGVVFALVRLAFSGGVSPSRVTFDDVGVVIDWRFRRVAIRWDELWSLERVSRPGRYERITILTWRRLDNSTVTMADAFDPVPLADQIERHAPHALVLLDG